MIDELTRGIADVWTAPALIAAVFGGLTVGLVVEYTSPHRDWRVLAGLTIGIGTLAVAVFWSGQIADAVVSGDPNWGRAVGRAVLQELFVIAVAVSAGLARARDRTSS